MTECMPSAHGTIAHDERPQVLGRVYALLIQLAEEKRAAVPDETIDQTRTTASDILVVEAKSHEAV